MLKECAPSEIHRLKMATLSGHIPLGDTYSEFRNSPLRLALGKIRIAFLALLFAALTGCYTPAGQSLVARPNYGLAVDQGPLTSPPSAQSSDNHKVWVNTPSGVYHYPGTRWYGNTNEGEYMSEKDALVSGYRPAENGQ
jgi:hypothetical protein